MERKMFLVLAGALLFSGCAMVDSGEMGIIWGAFTGTRKQLYGEGLYIVAPWNKMYIYDIRTQDRKEVLHILTQNGLSVDMETSIRFRPKTDELFELHTQIGPDYFNIVIGPTVRSEARKVGGRFTPEEIYSTKRESVELEILEEVRKVLVGKHVDVETILVRDVNLPTNIKNAIADKLEEEQKALKMQFTLQRERQEAERKAIEAEGIANFQRIVNQGLTENLLKWKGIEATEKLSTSQNAKVVVIGAGKEGLPLILGGER